MEKYTFDVAVTVGNFIERTKPTSFVVLAGDSGFGLPELLMTNDESLQIECISSQKIFKEPIKTSSMVVTRTFYISDFYYTPRIKQRTFLFQMVLQPTVNITSEHDIIVRLNGFSNILGRYNIHLTGEDASVFDDTKAQWNETVKELTFKVPEGEQIDEFTILRIRIEESQGFVLPLMLYANDTSLTVQSGVPGNYNIMVEPVKFSPMIGDGPFK